MLLYFTGLVAIRYGSQTVDPVTGLLAPVVGARLDASRKNVVPVTSSYWLMIRDQTDSVQVTDRCFHKFPLLLGDIYIFYFFLPGGGTSKRGVCAKRLLAATEAAGGRYSN